MRLSFLIIILSVVLSGFQLKAQTAYLDSLQREALVDRQDTLTAKSLIRYGFALTNAGQHKEALVYLEKALKLAQKLNFKRGIANAYSVSGTAYMYSGDFKKSEEFYLFAQKMFETNKDLKGVGITYNNLGIVYDRLGDFNKSIKCYKKSIEIKKQQKDLEGVSTAYGNIGNLYIEKGDYLKGIDYHFQSLQIEKSIGNKRGEAKSLESIGILYENLNQIEKALENFKQAEIIYNELKDEPALTNLFVNYGNTYYRVKNFVAAEEYFDKAIVLANKIQDLRMIGISYGNIGLILSEKGEYEKSIQNFRQALNYSVQTGEKRGFLNQYLNMSKTFLKMSLLDSAMAYGVKANNLALNIGLIELAISTEKNLSEIYDAKGDFKNAFVHYKSYKLFSDSMVTVTKQKQMSELFVKYETRLQANENEQLKQRNKINELTIKNNRFTFLTICLALAAILLIVAIIYFRNKARYQEEKANLEQMTLRLQMNPHFIFNAVNSIQRYILQKDKHEAYTYLTKFSQLMRDVLNTANEKNVTLTRELEMLNLYIELEQLRFEDSFDFSLELQDDIDTDSVYLPGLLIQPFVENAIWHGIMPLENSRRGILKVKLKRQGKAILIQIEDNGIGREQSEKIKKSANHKSMGMKLSKKRLELFKNNNNVRNAIINIEDIKDESGGIMGTRVSIYLE